MLKTFFEIEINDQEESPLLSERINRKLFTGGEVDLGIDGKKFLPRLKIAELDKEMNHQGKYPVILLDFKDIKGNNYQEIEDGIKERVITLFSKYPYLRQYLVENNDFLVESQKKKLNKYLSGEISKVDLHNSLKFLSEILCKHFKQEVYILIDEYDAVINDSCLKLKSEELDNILELFRAILGTALKGNPYLKKGILTGILRIAKASLFTNLNNISEYNLLDKEFAEYYGFTQEEVDELLKRVPTVTRPEEIKEWYNGYYFGGQTVYNPWSIMSCLSEKGVLKSYWADSGGTKLFNKTMLSDEVQADFQILLKGQNIIKKLYEQVDLEQIQSETQESNDVFYSLLVFTGYLNPKSFTDDPKDSRYELNIPNQEIKEIYEDKIIQ